MQYLKRYLRPGNVVTPRKRSHPFFGEQGVITEVKKGEGVNVLWQGFSCVKSLEAFVELARVFKDGQPVCS